MLLACCLMFGCSGHLYLPKTALQSAQWLSMLYLQDGYFLVLEQDHAILHNITGTSPATGYTIFAGADMPSSYNLSLANGTCSNNQTAPNITQVDTCALSYPDNNICCINTRAYKVCALLLGCSKATHATAASKTRTYSPATFVY